MILAIDFDGTLAENGAYPKIGKPIKNNIDYVKKMKEEGHKLILWTCRELEPLSEAISWCKNQGIIFDAINENIDPEKQKLGFGYNSRKIYADIYFDDKAIKSI